MLIFYILTFFCYGKSVLTVQKIFTHRKQNQRERILINMREELRNAIVDGFEPEAKDLVNKLLAENADPVELVSGVLIPAMDTVADLWKNGD